MLLPLVSRPTDGTVRRSAELESVLGATPQGFESLILRSPDQGNRWSFEGAVGVCQSQFVSVDNVSPVCVSGS